MPELWQGVEAINCLSDSKREFGTANRNTCHQQEMEINPRRKRAFHLYDNTLAYNTDSFGFIADRSMYSTMLTTDAPPSVIHSEQCTKDITRNIINEEYLAAAARLAPFLPIQLRNPSIPKQKGRNTRRRDWWATQKRRLRWRRNITHKVIAYRRRRTFRGQK